MLALVQLLAGGCSAALLVVLYEGNPALVELRGEEWLLLVLLRAVGCSVALVEVSAALKDLCGECSTTVWRLQRVVECSVAMGEPLRGSLMPLLCVRGYSSVVVVALALVLLRLWVECLAAMVWLSALRWRFVVGLIGLWCCLRLGFGHWSWVPRGDERLMWVVVVMLVVPLVTGWRG